MFCNFYNRFLLRHENFLLERKKKSKKNKKTKIAHYERCQVKTLSLPRHRSLRRPTCNRNFWPFVRFGRGHRDKAVKKLKTGKRENKETKQCFARRQAMDCGKKTFLFLDWKTLTPNTPCLTCIFFFFSRNYKNTKCNLKLNLDQVDEWMCCVFFRSKFLPPFFFFTSIHCSEKLFGKKILNLHSYAGTTFFLKILSVNILMQWTKDEAKINHWIKKKKTIQLKFFEMKCAQVHLGATA